MSLSDEQGSASEEALKRLGDELFQWQEIEEGIEEDKDYSSE